MVETHTVRRHPEHVVLDIGRDVGALVIYTDAGMHDQEIEVSVREPDSKRVHTVVHERSIGGRTAYAGVFPGLAAGEYNVWGDAGDIVMQVRIEGGRVAEVDLRHAPAVPSGR